MNNLPEFEIEMINSNCLTRLGRLKGPIQLIETPLLWISYEFHNPPNLWKYLNRIDSMLVNVHNIEDRKMLLKKIVKYHDLRKSIRFNGKIMLDSGGVKFSGQGRRLNIEKILSLEKIINPDILISPDYPISPYNTVEENRSRIQISIQNLYETINIAKGRPTLIMPVVHGYTFNQIDYAVKHIRKVVGEINLIGLGSLVPLLVPFTFDKAKKVIDLIIYTRKKLPYAFLHVFGIGSILTMHLAFLAGADSIDSQSWVRSAGYAKIQVAGEGQLFVKKNKRKYRYEQWSREVLKNSFNCDCPVCKKNGLACLIYSKKFRAIHNAYTLCSEANLIRKMVKEGEYAFFAKERLKNTALFALFKYIQEKIKQM